MDIRMAVGLRIKEMRKQAQLTQEDLALITDLDRTYINSVENGKRNVSIVNLHKITKGLNTTLWMFFASDHFKNC